MSRPFPARGVAPVTPTGRRRDVTPTQRAAGVRPRTGRSRPRRSRSASSPSRSSGSAPSRRTSVDTPGSARALRCPAAPRWPGPKSCPESSALAFSSAPTMTHSPMACLASATQRATAAGESSRTTGTAKIGPSARRDGGGVVHVDGVTGHDHAVRAQGVARSHDRPQVAGVRRRVDDERKQMPAHRDPSHFVRRHPDHGQQFRGAGLSTELAHQVRRQLIAGQRAAPRDDLLPPALTAVPVAHGSRPRTPTRVQGRG